MSRRIIFHVDVNSAFLSWEATYRKEILGEETDLREIPSAIGGDKEQRKGIILAKSTPAKAYQIQTGEPIVAALRKCPQLTIVKPNFKLYVQCSKAFMTILREYSPIVEQYSIDEAFMDMTGMEGIYGEQVALAHIIKDRIYKELGFTVNIGVSTNKILAKMASDFKKPNLVHTLFPEEIEEKMWPLPVRELFYVGKSAEKTLNLLGIKTIGQLAKADEKLLKLHLKKQGGLIRAYANGIDPTEVTKIAAANKGYGNSMTLPFDVYTNSDAKHVFLSLCETVGARLRTDQVEAGCVSVSIVDSEFNHSSMQMTLHQPTNHTKELYEYACQLFEKLWDHQSAIRQLGVATSKLSDTTIHQLSMFEVQQDKKFEKLDKVIDTIREKYGDDIIKRASFLNSKFDHMAGGISKEKKNGITKEVE